MSSPAAINASLLLWETLFGTDNVCCITAPPPPFYIFLQRLNGCLFILAAQQRPSQTAIVISPPLWQMHTKCGIGLRLSSAVDLCLFLKSVFKLCWRRGHTVIWRYSTCLHSEAFAFLTGQQIRGGGGDVETWIIFLGGRLDSSLFFSSVSGQTSTSIMDARRQC